MQRCSVRPVSRMRTFSGQVIRCRAAIASMFNSGASASTESGRNRVSPAGGRLKPARNGATVPPPPAPAPPPPPLAGLLPPAPGPGPCESAAVVPGGGVGSGGEEGGGSGVLLGNRLL